MPHSLVSVRDARAATDTFQPSHAVNSMPDKPRPTSSKVSGPASYFPSIEKTYGQPIAHWMTVLRAAGPRKHGEFVARLKSDHAMGHGHANALVAYFLTKG